MQTTGTHASRHHRICQAQENTEIVRMSRDNIKMSQKAGERERERERDHDRERERAYSQR